MYTYVYTYTYIHIYIFFPIFFHYGLLWDIDYSSLCYTIGPCCLIHSIYKSVHMLIPNSSIVLPYHPSLGIYKPVLSACESVCWEGLWRRNRLPTPVFLGFPFGSAGKETACNVGDLGPIPGLGRSPGEGKGYPLQSSALENSMHCITHGVTESWT